MRHTRTLLTTLLLMASSLHAANAAKPNILYILADDLGYADAGFMGSKEIFTPELDKLAQAGTILSAYYVQPLCTPTRATLMTGRLPSRTGVYNIVIPRAPWGLGLEERTLPQALREAGYETAIVGKWHLGEFQEAYRPTKRGFDQQYGLWCGATDYFTHQRGGILDWYRNDQPCKDEGYSTHLLAREACRIIRAKSPDKPLFLYLPFNAVHSPYQAPDSYLKPYSHLTGERRMYAGMVSAMDEAVGQVVAALKETGLFDNTLIIFSSDNGGRGPRKVTSNRPLRAGKDSLYEGGIRVCAFASWPGQIPAGKTVSEPLQGVDWFPTLLTLAGASLEQKPPLDGRDIWSVLTQGAKSPHDSLLVCATKRGDAALRMGDWKLVRMGDRDELYNLASDLGEKKDLAPAQPEKLKELQAKLDSLMKDAAPDRRGVVGDETAPAQSVAEGQSAGLIQVKTDAIINRVSRTMFGVNLEDLTTQCYGGLYSQLLYGESFQEHVDIPMVNVPAHLRMDTNITIQADGRVVVDQLDQAGRNIVPLSAPPEVMQQVIAVATGREQISKWWRMLQTGSASGAFFLDREGAYRGRHSQRIVFEGGEGELGIENMGPFRWGIPLQAGKPYEGLLRVKSKVSQDLYVSFRSQNGTRKLAEQTLRLEGKPDEYQRVAFSLTPTATDEKGRFTIALKQAGEVVLGYAFVQPGEWGRFKGLPLRKDLVQALIDQGVTVLRYNGSMVNGCPDGHLYKWKEMIGPRDQRKPYTGRFNRFASHGFAIFDALNLAEAAGFLPIVGIRTDETPQDVKDLIEYANGPIATTWGKKRAEDGHPEPYRLKYIEIGNEEGLNGNYVARFKLLADALWSVDRSLVPVVANNAWHWVPLSTIDTKGHPVTGQYTPKISENGVPEDGNLQNAVEIVKFARERGNRIWWDTHYWASKLRYTDDKRMAVETCYMLRDFMDRLVPGSDLQVAPLEENGGGFTLKGALSRAVMHNAFSRKGNHLTAFAVANAFQADGPQRHWPQGKTFFNAAKVWHQPAYYVDQMQSRNWEPNVVACECRSPGNALDALAKVSDDGKTLVLYVVNLAPGEVQADLRFAGFRPRKQVWAEQLRGNLNDFNTAAKPQSVAPTRGQPEMKDNAFRFPGNSFTVLKFTRIGTP